MVVDAKYGVLEAITKAEAEERERASNADEDTPSASDVAASTEEIPEPSSGEAYLLKGSHLYAMHVCRCRLTLQSPRTLQGSVITYHCDAIFLSCTEHALLHIFFLGLT